MDKIENPVKQSPIICYLHHAYALAIIMNYPQFLPWFYSHYIQLFCYINSKIFFNFYTPYDIFHSAPCLDNKYFHKKDVVLMNVDAKQFINDYIKEGYYVCTYLNEFYMPGKSTYKVSDFEHECLIYGYDNVNRRYSILGFNSRANYVSDYLNYEVFDAAYMHAFKDDILVLSRVKPEYEPGFDVGLVKLFLRDYIYSGNTSRLYDERNDFVWGIKVFECLKPYLDRVVAEGSFPDFRFFHVFWEHKKCLLDRINYMLQNGYIQSPSHYASYLDIEKKFLILRNTVYKFNLICARNNTPCDRNMAEKILILADKAVENEVNILENLLSELEHLNKDGLL